MPIVAVLSYRPMTPGDQLRQVLLDEQQAVAAAASAPLSLSLNTCLGTASADQQDEHGYAKRARAPNGIFHQLFYDFLVAFDDFRSFFRIYGADFLSIRYNCLIGVFGPGP